MVLALYYARVENPYAERPSTSPLLQWVWRAHPGESGSYQDLASEFWHIAFLVENGKTRVVLSGPSTEARPISYLGGQYYWGFVFKSHVFMPSISKKQLLNAVMELPVEGDQFIFGGTKFTMPTYDTADAFADELARLDLIVADEQVAKALHGTGRMSKRSLQRHLEQATGLSQTKLRLIERARYAFALLQRGTPLAEVAAKAGYTDQAHLTKSLKLLAGQTPAQILADYTAN